MRLRGWTILIAVIGVLLHAGILVRHNGNMLASALAPDQLTADLRVICHGGVEDPSTSSPDRPSNPSPTDAKGNCPICMGHAPAFVLAAPEQLDVFAPPMIGFELGTLCRILFVQRSAVCPPARGPPEQA
jgi:hypothetical protein